MEQVILIVHVLAALGIIGLIMIQQGKGADMGASFGAGASQTLLGSGGSGNVVTKTTAILATLFFATSFGLAVVAKNNASQQGMIDLPTVVESRDMPQLAPAAVSDIPTMDEAAIESVIAEPSTDFDVPVSDAPVESGSDIPEM